MALQVSGRVVRDRAGLEVIVERRIAASSAEVWRTLTTASRAKRWTSGTVVVLEPDARVDVLGDGWNGIISLAPLDQGCVVYAKERAESARAAATAGPRWEHSLDRLIAAVTSGRAPVGLAQYEATLRPAYERLAMDGDPVSWPPS